MNSDRRASAGKRRATARATCLLSLAVPVCDTLARAFRARPRVSMGKRRVLASPLPSTIAKSLSLSALRRRAVRAATRETYAWSPAEVPSIADCQNFVVLKSAGSTRVPG